MQDYYDKIADAIYDGEDEEAAELAKLALEAGADPENVINEGGVAGLERLGKAFDEMEAFLPELMLGGEAMHSLLEVVKPYLKNSDKDEGATVVVGCAQGDLHDIGLNHARIIGVSSLLTTSAYYQEELVKKLEKDGIRDRYKVIVGGGPITPEWTRKIGADGYSRTANQAVQLCKQLLSGNSDSPIIIQ